MATNILLSTQYNFDTPMVYAEDSASEGVYYTSSAEQIADEVTLPRFTALYKNSSTGMVAKLNSTVPTGNASKQSKSADYTQDAEDTFSYTTGVIPDHTFTGGSNKYHMITAVEIKGGPYFSPSSYGPNTITASDLTDGAVSITYTYDGEVYFDMTQTRFEVYYESGSDIVDYTKDTDYTAEATLTTNEAGKKVFVGTITVIAESNLATDLTAGQKTIKFGVDPYQVLTSLVEGKDYAVEYTYTGTGTNVNCKVHWLKEISGSVYIYYKQPTQNGKFYGIAIHDTALNDPRTIAVWTSGYFDSSKIPNYCPFFSATEGFSFK